jgi:hypothetical protein
MNSLCRKLVYQHFGGCDILRAGTVAPSYIIITIVSTSLSDAACMDHRRQGVYSSGAAARQGEGNHLEGAPARGRIVVTLEVCAASGVVLP